MKKFLKGAVIGAAVGGLVVALTTPKKGSELREQIKVEGAKATEKGMEHAAKLKEVSSDVAEKTVEKVGEAKDVAASKTKDIYDSVGLRVEELKKKVTKKEDDYLK